VVAGAGRRGGRPGLTGGAVGGRLQGAPVVLAGGAVAIVGDRIAEIGPAAALERRWRPREILDAAGGAVTPALCDPHTTWRSPAARRGVRGAGRGGPLAPGLARGIAHTVERTRAASDEELKGLIRARLDRALAGGVTLLESKSGYGLTVESELRLLRLDPRAAAGHPVEVVTTVLAAHSLPPAYVGRAAPTSTR